jgi:hypothetical protein
VLAAGGSIIPFLIMLLILGFMSLIQKLAKVQAPQQRPGRPPRPENPDVQRQIEEFLRRATERNAGRVPQGDRPAQPPAAATTAQRGPRKATKAEPAAPPAPETAEEAPVGSRLAGQVQQDINTAEFTRRSRELGGKVVQGDQQFEEHVDQAFQGEISALSQRPGETASAPRVEPAKSPTFAEVARPVSTIAGVSFTDLLTSPETILQAIVVSEILRRPDWE